MGRKTVILNGSPRPEGNTAALIAQLRRHLSGEVIEISAFRSNIAPCVDCRGCWTTAECVIHDEMQVFYEDDFDNFVIASPVYFGNLPGPVLSVMSRMQPWHAAMFFLNKPMVQRPKKAAAILTAGGNKNETSALRHMGPFFKMTNATGAQDHVVYSSSTDTIPAWEDEKAMAQVAELARWLNEE